VVDELVGFAHREALGRFGQSARRSRHGPRLAAVVGALDDLPEPAARLRHVDAVRIDGRALHVINLPAREMRAVDGPLLSFAVGGKDEGALAGADEDTDAAHWECSFVLDGPSMCSSKGICASIAKPLLLDELLTNYDVARHLAGVRPTGPSIARRACNVL